MKLIKAVFQFDFSCCDKRRNQSHWDSLQPLMRGCQAGPQRQKLKQSHGGTPRTGLLLVVFAAAFLIPCGTTWWRPQWAGPPQTSHSIRKCPPALHILMEAFSPQSFLLPRWLRLAPRGQSTPPHIIPLCRIQLSAGSQGTKKYSQPSPLFEMRSNSNNTT